MRPRNQGGKMLHRHFLTGVVVLAAAVAARGEVAVELLNMPTHVRSFEPMYVLFAVENTGKRPLYLPAEPLPGRGPAVYFAPAGEEPRWFGVTGDWIFPHAEQTLWLAPGERWLYYKDISYWMGVLEGDVTVQVVLSSDGHCGDKQVGGRHSYPLEPLHEDTLKVGVKSFEVFRCWQGEVRSNEWTLTVERPMSAVDQQAFEYLEENQGIVHDKESGRWRLVRGAGLEKRFPGSNYTYAVLAREPSSLEQKRRAIELQPSHPLNPWVEGAIELQELNLAASQGKSVEVPSGTSKANESLPSGVQEFLAQHRWALEHRLQQAGGD